MSLHSISTYYVQNENALLELNIHLNILHYLLSNKTDRSHENFGTHLLVKKVQITIPEKTFTLQHISA